MIVANGETFDSVWDAIEDSPADAANMKARSALMMALQHGVDSWAVSQAEAAKRLGISQPRLNALLRGKINDFSLDALVNLLPAAGLAVDMNVRAA